MSASSICMVHGCSCKYMWEMWWPWVYIWVCCVWERKRHMALFHHRSLSHNLGTLLGTQEPAFRLEEAGSKFNCWATVSGRAKTSLLRAQELSGRGLQGRTSLICWTLKSHRCCGERRLGVFSLLFPTVSFASVHYRCHATGNTKNNSTMTKIDFLVPSLVPLAP